MKIAFVLYEGMTALDFTGIYDPLTRLRSMGFIPDLEWDLVAFSTPVRDSLGMLFTPTQIKPPLGNYNLVIVPGGSGSRVMINEPDFITWLSGASSVPQVASVCSGALLLAKAGLLQNRQAATHPNAVKELSDMGIRVVEARLVEDGNILTCGGVTAGIDLGLYLCRKLAGKEAEQTIRRQMDYPYPLPPVYTATSSPLPDARISHVLRRTRETQVEISLRLDGSGQHHIDSGLPFLDHMLTQVAVHGLFDLDLTARGDLHIDPHHTVEDIGLALGQAFREALGSRVGIVRMGAESCPMDESLAQVCVDFSGRPYAVIQVEWHAPMLGTIPVSLFDHFLESFATEARCNLHVRILYGKDDHHQAEAIFKAWGRAMSAAVRPDPRRAGQIPSSKGTLA